MGYAVGGIQENVVQCITFRFNRRQSLTLASKHVTQIMKIQFTPEQQAIIDLTFGEHLVLAPPGTGKTELLSERILNALNQGYNQNDLICLTFTNRAAANMVARISNKIGDNEIFIGNMHRWCSEFLYKNRIIPQNTILLDEEDVLLIIDEIKSELGIKSNHRAEFLKYNTYLKQKALGFPEEILLPSNLIEMENVSISKAEYSSANFRYEGSLSPTQKAQTEENINKRQQEFKIALTKFVDEYEKIKVRSLYIDFDDLLTLSYDFLIKNRGIYLSPWLQVDEVQDLNPMQWAIINLISNKKSHRVFFGDYEQAIFSFMGAKVNSLKVIEQQGAEIHTLSKNFRSPANLLKLFNAYAIKWLNPQWKTAPIAAIVDSKEHQQPLQFRRIFGEPEGEAKWIVEKKLPKEPQNPTAILVRTNKAADMYASELDKKYLEYFKVSGFDVFKRKEVKDIFAFFQTLLNAEDRRSWARVFWLFGKVESLKRSRHIINRMFEVGIRPTDFIKPRSHNHCFLDHIFYALKSHRIVVFDTETTGLDVENDDIIQIAAIEIINGKKGREFEVYINTEKDLTASEKIHHISKEHLNKHSMDKAEALSKFREFVDNNILIAHNIRYDEDILFFNNERENLKQLPNDVEFIDSIDIAKRLYPTLVSYKLEYLIKEFNIEGKNSHNAIDDVRATVNLLLYFKDKIHCSEESRNDFVSEYQSIINNFTQRYSPLYVAVTGRFSDQLPLDEVTAMVLAYLDSLSVKPFEEGLYDEISKITRFMKEKCELAEVFKSLKKYVPEFLKYSEVDLVLGNEKIFIATIHKAKGLEFENVIIPQVVEDNFPYFNSVTNDKILEDARLLYVAMTRAKTNLLLTRHTVKSSASIEHIKNLSRFIETKEIKLLFQHANIHRDQYNHTR